MNVTTKALLAAVGLTLVTLLALESLVRPDPGRRNFEIFTEMSRSPAPRTQGLSEILPGGVVNQPVPEGVIVRGSMPFRFGDGPEEASRAGLELASPLEKGPELAARGAELYRVFCVLCHGADGAGQGPLVQRGMRPPPSLLGARALAMPDGEMFHVLTRGQGTMASYALQLAAEERWMVIHHVRTLQEASR